MSWCAYACPYIKVLNTSTLQPVCVHMKLSLSIKLASLLSQLPCKMLRDANSTLPFWKSANSLV